MTSLQNAWVVFDKPIKFLIKLCGYVGKYISGERVNNLQPSAHTSSVRVPGKLLLTKYITFETSQATLH